MVFLFCSAQQQLAPQKPNQKGRNYTAEGDVKEAAHKQKTPRVEDV